MEQNPEREESANKRHCLNTDTQYFKMHNKCIQKPKIPLQKEFGIIHMWDNCS